MGVAAIFYMFAGGGITNGLIRNISAAPSVDEHQRWITTGITINALTTLILAGFAITLAIFDGGSILGDRSYWWVYIIIAVAQAVVGIGNVVLAYFSGTGDSRTFAIAHIAGNTLSVLIIIILIQILGLGGAICGLVLPPALIAAVALWQFFRKGGDRGIFRITWERPMINSLFSYAAAWLSAVTAVPVAQLMIRLDMSESSGWSFVGYWQAVTKLSDAYMLFIGVIFINYLLPKLSRLPDDATALQAVVRFGKPLVGLFIIGATTIYFAREYVILIVYSRSFLPASDLVLPQLFGDALKITGLLLNYYFISQRRILVVITLELTQGVGLYIFYRLFATYGAVAPVFGHVASSALTLALALGMLQITKRPV
jgi:PST family polysaccharide transporter